MAASNAVIAEEVPGAKTPALSEAFAAASAVRDALRRAVDADFKPVGKYEATNPFDLELPAYMAIIVASMLTMGTAAVLYWAASEEANAKKDDYRREPERHFELTQKRLAKKIKGVPEGDERRLLQKFAAQASFAFHMEKAALAAATPDNAAGGLREMRAGRRYADDRGRIGKLQADYRAGAFPGRGDFLKELDAAFPHMAPVASSPPAPASRRLYAGRHMI